LGLTAAEQLLHKHFFHEMGERTRSFLKGLSWLMRATLISKILSGSTTLYVMLRLGASAFGDASVSLALTQWIQLPMYMGLLTALMHYLPQSSDRDKSMWITTCLDLTVLFTLVTVGVGLATRSYWARIWDVSPRMVEMAIAWCIGFQIYSVATSIFSASEDFRSRAYAEITYAVFFPLMIGAFLWRHHLSAMHYIGSLALAYALAGLCGLAMVVRRSHLSTFNPRFVGPLLTYGGLAGVGVLVHALMNSPAQLIAYRYLQHSQVGILSAYQSASIQAGLYLLGVGSQVFFPIASRTPNPVVLLKKIIHTFFKAAPFLYVFQILFLLVFFKILKRGGYPLQWNLVMIFSFAAVTAFLQGILMWYMSSQGMRAMFHGYGAGIVAGLVNLGLCVVLIKRWQVFGSGVAMSISSIVCIVGCYVLAPKNMRSIAGAS
jgi:O-antigen/teichoic acid export membrane protein